MVKTLLFIFITALVLCSLNISAQNIFLGTVKDAITNKPLRRVILRMPDIQRAVVTDSLGNYNFSNLPKGSYLLEVSLEGYASVVETIVIHGRLQKYFQLQPSVRLLKEVVVTGTVNASEKQSTPYAMSVLNHTDLLQSSSTNVIDAVAKTPGVSAITNGQSISKPVIRGLGFNRVLTIIDGVPQVDQAWFDEFGIEADPDAVNRFEILKGPASLSYGSDAIAGVLNLLPEQPLPEGQVKGDVLFNYQTNNGLYNSMLHMAGTNNGISWGARVDNIMAHAYRNPKDGYVLNSQFSNFNGDGTLGIHRKWGYSQVHLSYFDMKTGIVDGTRDSLSGQLERPVAYPQVNGGAPFYVLPTNQEKTSYTPFLINQHIRHTKVVLDNSVAIGDGRVKGIFSFQKNQRQENNDPTMPDVSDIYYSSNAATYDLKYISPQLRGFNFSAGTNGVYQNSKSLGTLLLIPDYNFFQIGVFAIASQKINKLNISGGLRYDTRSFNGSDHWVDSTNQAPVAPNAPNSIHEFQGFKSRFNGLSFSAGATYDFTSNFYIKTNIARGWRAPNVAEATANGVHDGTVVYEIGDMTLHPETSLQEDLGIGARLKDIDFELSLFNNRIYNFIYSRGLKSLSGADSINNSLNAAGLGEAPVYKYTQGGARLYGGEAVLNIHPRAIPNVELNTSLSMVYGGLLNSPDSTKYLPFVPPTRITADLKYRFVSGTKTLRNIYLRTGVLSSFDQQHIYRQYAIYNGLNTALTPYEYAASKAATKGYTLFNIGAGGDIYSKGRKICEIYVLCNNLFNTAYIDYMSRFKYFPVNYTTGRVGVFNMGRNVSFKIVIPLDFSSGKG